ncbi:hypothetical protein ACORG1_33880 (plasmid) [Mycobacterium sp. TJFP1]
MSSFVITAVQSGDPALAEQLPAAGYTVNMLADAHGAPAFHAVLQRPLRFYYDATFDGSRIATERFGRDAYGPFLWVTEVILSPRRPDELPYPSMKNFAMNLTAVLEPAGDGAELLPANTAAWGVALVDDMPEEPAHDPREVADDNRGAPPPPRTPPTAHAAQRDRPRAVPAPDPASRGPLDEAHVVREVAALRAQIAALAGWPISQIQEPKCVKAGKENRQGGPAYSVSRHRYRYFTKDIWQGCVLRETDDPDELLYWIADDVTRSAAWEWTKRAPSFGKTLKGPEAQRVITMPMWHTLMYALRYEWGQRTRLVAEQQTQRGA